MENVYICKIKVLIIAVIHFHFNFGANRMIKYLMKYSEKIKNFKTIGLFS